MREKERGPPSHSDERAPERCQNSTPDGLQNTKRLRPTQAENTRDVAFGQLCGSRSSVNPRTNESEMDAGDARRRASTAFSFHRDDVEEFERRRAEYKKRKKEALSSKADHLSGVSWDA